LIKKWNSISSWREYCLEANYPHYNSVKLLYLKPLDFERCTISEIQKLSHMQLEQWFSATILKPIQYYTLHLMNIQISILNYFVLISMNVFLILSLLVSTTVIELIFKAMTRLSLTSWVIICPSYVRTNTRSFLCHLVS
jgi:hypothetical protein